MEYPALYAKSDSDLADPYEVLAIWQRARVANVTPAMMWKLLDRVDDYPGDIFWPEYEKNAFPEVAFTKSAYEKFVGRFLRANIFDPQLPIMDFSKISKLDYIRWIDLGLQVLELNQHRHRARTKYVEDVALANDQK